MITNLEIVDDDTAKAFGHRFDVGRVLDAMIAFLEGFVAEVAAADPSDRPTIRFPGDGDAIIPFDGDACARLRRETLTLATRWDVVKHPVRIDVGPFALRIHPLGRDDLYRFGACEPTMIDESDWRDLDPTPLVEFSPVRGIPIFDDGAMQVIQKLIIRHRPPGTRPDFARVPHLRFPSSTFGIGLGDLRISLLTIPVQP